MISESRKGLRRRTQAPTLELSLTMETHDQPGSAQLFCPMTHDQQELAAREMRAAYKAIWKKAGRQRCVQSISALDPS